MDEELERLAYKIHGVISSSDSDSDSGQEFDYLYYLLKPPPIDYESIKGNIVEIHTKIPSCDEHIKHMTDNKNILMGETRQDQEKIKKKKERKSKSAKKEKYFNENDKTTILSGESHILDANINVNHECVLNDTIKESEYCSEIPLDSLESKNNHSVCSQENKTLSSPGQDISSSGISSNIDEISRIRKLLQCDVNELIKLQIYQDKLNWPTLEMSTSSIKKKVRCYQQREKDIYEKWFKQYLAEIGEDISIPCVCSDEKKRIHRLLRLDITELSQIKIDYGKLKQRNGKVQIEDLQQREQVIYEKWFKQYISEMGHLKQRGKIMYEKWLKGKYFEDENVDKNKIQQFNSIENNVQMNEFGLIKDNTKKRKKTKKRRKREHIHNKIKTNMEVSDKNKSKEIIQVHNEMPNNTVKVEVGNNSHMKKANEVFDDNQETNHQNSSSGSILSDCFNDSIQNVLDERYGVLRPCLSNSRKVINRIQQELKENYNQNKGLLCLKTRYFQLSLNESVKVIADTNEKERTTLYQICGTDPKEKSQKNENSHGFVQATESNVNVNHLTNDNNVAEYTFEEILYQICGTDPKKKSQQNKNSHGFVQATESNVNVNHLTIDNNVAEYSFEEILKIGVRCYSYNFIGENFQSCMEFSETNFSMFLDNMVTNKENTNDLNRLIKSSNYLKNSNKIYEIIFDETLKNYLSCYYDYTHFRSSIKFRETYLCVSLDNITESKEPSDRHRKSNIKVNNLNYHNISENTFKETLRNDVSCYYYNYIGPNFQSYMKFRETYLYMSLVNLTEKAERALYDVAQSRKSNINPNHLNDGKNVSKNTLDDTLKYDISCYYYDYTGSNFQSYMEFREIYLYMSLANIPERILNTKRKIRKCRAEKKDNPYGLVQARKSNININHFNVSNYTSENIIDETPTDSSIRCNYCSRKKNQGKNITIATKCRKNDLDKVYNHFQDYNSLPKQITNIDNYELFLRVMHVLFILLLAHATRVVIFQYLYIYLFCIFCLAVLYFYLLKAIDRKQDKTTARSNKKSM